MIICLTDNSSKKQQFYLNLVDNPDVIQFESVDYSYNNLYSLCLTLADSVASYSTGITLYGMSKVTFSADSPHKGYKGDSGCPVYAGHVLYGIYSGDNANTSTSTDATYYWFSPINGVATDMFSVKIN